MPFDTLGPKEIANDSLAFIVGLRSHTMMPLTILPQPELYAPLGSWSV